MNPLDYNEEIRLHLLASAQDLTRYINWLRSQEAKGKGLGIILFESMAKSANLDSDAYENIRSLVENHKKKFIITFKTSNTIIISHDNSRRTNNVRQSGTVRDGKRIAEGKNNRRV